MIRGSCLCGSITYELDTTPEIMNLCHCSMCRKVSGASYGVFAHLPIGNFRWIEGEALIRKYQSSKNNVRNFCTRCGSNMPNEDDDEMCIPAGTLDDNPGLKARFQIFENDKAPWHDVDPSIESFAEFPPDEWEP